MWSLDRLPRTLIGAGGVRLIDMPGVVYPREVIAGRKGWDRRSGRPYTKVPEWGISSREAARLMGCTLASARATLSRHKVRRRKVQGDDKVMRLYWKKEQVMALVESRAPLADKRPPKLITVPEALAILKVARSSLYRYVQRGRLREVKMRFSSPQRGARVKSLFVRAEVRKLAVYLRALREKEREINLLRSGAPKSKPERSEPGDSQR